MQFISSSLDQWDIGKIIQGMGFSILCLHGSLNLAIGKLRNAAVGVSRARSLKSICRKSRRPLKGGVQQFPFICQHLICIDQSIGPQESMLAPITAPSKARYR
jgi:hypothetical protein